MAHDQMKVFILASIEAANAAALYRISIEEHQAR